MNDGPLWWAYILAEISRLMADRQPEEMVEFIPALFQEKAWLTLIGWCNTALSTFQLCTWTLQEQLWPREIFMLMSRQIWFSARCKPITSIDILATKNEVAEMLLWCRIINKLKVMKNAVERSCISKAYEQSGEPEYRSTLNCVSLYAAFFLLFLSTSSTYRLFPWLAQAERLYRFLSEGLGHIHGSACFLDSWNFFFLNLFHASQTLLFTCCLWNTASKRSISELEKGGSRPGHASSNGVTFIITV